MEKALEKLPEHERDKRRLRLEHAQIMKLEDLERAAKLGSKSLSCKEYSIRGRYLLAVFVFFHASYCELSTDSCDFRRELLSDRMGCDGSESAYIPGLIDVVR